MYGHIYVVRGSLDNQESSFPFIVSRHFRGQEVVYGTVMNLMIKIAGLIFGFEQWHSGLHKYVPDEIKPSIKTVKGPAETVFEMPESEHTDLFLQQLEERLEETVILTLMHLRTLLEIFSGKGNASIGLYDYEDNRIGVISLMDIANLLMHHRYLVVQNYCIHNIFSDKEQLPSQRLIGSKFRVHELFKATIDLLTNIKISDFVGVLRSRLARLSVDSEARDIVFLIQNISSIKYIMQERFTDSKFSEVTDLLFRDMHQLHREELQRNRKPGPGLYSFEFQFARPEFKIDDDLTKRRIVMHIRVNGESEEFGYGFEEFFGALTKACGNEALLSLEALRTGLHRFPSDFREQGEEGKRL